MIDTLLERDILPDSWIRSGIRRLLRQRLSEERRDDPEAQQRYVMDLLEKLRQSEKAVHTREANTQHYEVPTEFFQKVLGKHLKYSCGLWADGDSLNQSEERMLRTTLERAQIQKGQRVLELGCGWGSLSLFMAERFPQSTFVGVSNSRTQKEYIDGQIHKRGLNNLTILTRDINAFDTHETFDRIVSVEMFEHLRNYERVFEHLVKWLAPDGKVFIHIFVHKSFPYLFEAKSDSDWMSRHFFMGGIMPSDTLLLYFCKDLALEHHWRVNGRHYQKTSEAWLANMDRERVSVFSLFEKTYGRDQAQKWWVYWRVFFMSCAELWGYRKGTEWFVSHYLFSKSARRA